MKVVAFNGSPRKDGNTHLLLQMVLEPVAAAGIETEIIQIGGGNLHGCRACYRCRDKSGRCAFTDDDANAYIEKMKAADGILIGSPTYFADVTPETKCLIDRAGFVARSCGDFLARKVGAAVVAVRRGGEIHPYDTINHFFLIQQMIVPGSIYWNMGFGRDKGEVANDDEGIRTMTILGQNIAWLLQRIAQ